MLIRFRLILLIAALLFGNWPTVILADTPVQTLRQSSSQSFLLVASRKLTHPWFRETVILITQIAHQGPFGIIINRPQDITLDKILPEYPAARNFKLFAGGPVNTGQAFYLFRSAETVTGPLKVSEHLYLADGKSLLGELLNGSRAHTGLRVVNGLAGWAPGQLENEIARGDWYVLPTDDEVIFDHPVAEMWTELLRRATTIPHQHPEA